MAAVPLNAAENIDSEMDNILIEDIKEISEET
jgi:hypothetical protein